MSVQPSTPWHALAAGISHELRTPLAKIRMFTEMLLLDRARSEDERVRWLETIDRESHRLGDVMENLLLFIHAEEPDPCPARQPTDLGALIEDAVAGYAARAAALGMRISADPPAGIVVPVDAHAVRRAVGNLLDNALGFGPAGQTVEVFLEMMEPGQAVVSVTDQGRGVAPAERERVWEPFVCLAGEAGGEGGIGLGLAVVRRVVEAHGGRAWIDEAAGGGARVHLSLPVDGPAEPANEPFDTTIGS